MKIEEAIKQVKPFESEHERAVVNMLFTNGWITNRLKSLFSPHGITLKQYNLLRILRGAGKPLSTNEMRDRMIDKMSDVTRLIDRMLLKGWVIRSSNSLDKRLVDIEISPSGKKLLSDIDSAKVKTASILSQLTEEQVKTLNALLDQIRKN